MGIYSFDCWTVLFNWCCRYFGYSCNGSVFFVPINDFNSLTANLAGKYCSRESTLYFFVTGHMTKMPSSKPCNLFVWRSLKGICLGVVWSLRKVGCRCPKKFNDVDWFPMVEIFINKSLQLWNLLDGCEFIIIESDTLNNNLILLYADETVMLQV